MSPLALNENYFTVFRRGSLLTEEDHLCATSAGQKTGEKASLTKYYDYRVCG